MHKIDIYRDLGASLELKDGLSGGERVAIESPPALLQEGSKVKVAPEKEPTKAGPNNSAAK